MRTSVPLFPRSVSPVDTRPLSPTPSDVTAPDSEPEIDPESRVAKRRRIEQIAQQYLSGQQIFILTAGLKGPFDKNWTNPWGERSKRVDRQVVDETPGCAAISERKRRKIDSEREEAKAITHVELAYSGTTRVNNEKAQLGGGWGKVGSYEQSPLEGGPAFKERNKKTEQPTEPLKEILKVNSEATPSTKKRLKRATIPEGQRNPGPNYKGAAAPIIERQKPPDPATTVVAALLPQASNHSGATAATSVTTKPPGPPIHTSFTPINRSNKPAVSIQVSGAGVVAKAGVVDDNGTKTKKRPRHVDFAAISSPSKSKYTDRLDTTSKLKTKRKASQGQAKKSNDERTTGQQPTNQGGCELAPTVAQTRDLIPNAQSGYKRRESLENNISTQAEILNAQRLFRAEIPSPERKSLHSLCLAPAEVSFGTKASDATTPSNNRDIPAFRSLGTPNQGCNADRSNKSDSSNTDVISTQELIDAVSPFSFSTVRKRPRKGIFTKRAPSTQTPSKRLSFSLDGEDGAFGKMGLDMETSLEMEEPTILPQGDEERATTALREKVISTDASPSSQTALGALLPSLAGSSNIPAKGARKPDCDPNDGDSEEETRNCIDDISNYLEGWDLELELKRVATTKSAGIPAAANKKGILSGGLCQW
ncbi:hypothetical protein GP486_001854 [Trichoglossum hirsutum]|uniref:Uncharacterized protein n=1 Tax=Trichoglossum hirsutum TaxID=265104 RepID=A0A9P8LFC9_9PEZI|nr:hypothetical protein GP486_001854 [Trichoglossum hirsutum]